MLRRECLGHVVLIPVNCWTRSTIKGRVWLVEPLRMTFARDDSGVAVMFASIMLPPSATTLSGMFAAGNTVPDVPAAIMQSHRLASR